MNYASQTDEFWKQRVYKEERERHNHLTQHKIPESSSHVLLYPPSTKAFRPVHSPKKLMIDTSVDASSSSPKGAHSSRFPPLAKTPSPSKADRHSPHGPLPNHVLHHQHQPSPEKQKRPSHDEKEGFVPFRPRGPPASKHGADTHYQTYTFQGQAYIENNN